MPAVSGMIRTMAAVPRVHLANPQKNAEEISALLDIAEENGVQLCVFPELSLTGATCGDLFHQPALLRAAADADTNYLDYIELRSAIEKLGGECPERDFDDSDPMYEALSRMQ